MKMTPVNSSNIKAIGYNKLALELHVEFKSGKTFAYKYVSPSEYLDFLEADSVGKHFAQFIKPGRDAVEVVKEAVQAIEVVKVVEPQAVTYTINGKPYTEFDINKRCAELLGAPISFSRLPSKIFKLSVNTGGFTDEVNYCKNPADTDAIIDKCLNELMSVHMNDYYANWIFIMSEHKCTKLTAACICYIEINEA